jgi:hypothetical protein
MVDRFWVTTKTSPEQRNFIANQNQRFNLYNKRDLTPLEIKTLNKITIKTCLTRSDVYDAYLNYIFKDQKVFVLYNRYGHQFIIDEFFLLANYGKIEAIRNLKKRVISMSGIEDIKELSAQMRVYNKKYKPVKNSGMSKAAKSFKKSIEALGKLSTNLVLLQ